MLDPLVSQKFFGDIQLVLSAQEHPRNRREVGVRSRDREPLLGRNWLTLVVERTVFRVT
jgi:hypothetical protein